MTEQSDSTSQTRGEATMDDVLRTVEQRRKSVTVYGAPDSDLGERFATRNVRFHYRDLPDEVTDPFLVISEDEEFRAAISLSEFERFLSPPVTRPRGLTEHGPAYRAVFDLFDDTVFASLDRRQLLATSRELEDRARRCGDGVLRVGFQRLSAFDAQRSLYRRLATETDLDVHVYLREVPADDADVHGITFHDEPASVVGRYWFVAFDDGGEDSQSCALVAEERARDLYYGFWTYDPSLVRQVFDALEAP